MFVSARQMFRVGDANWNKWISWIGLQNVEEIRSLDKQINHILPNTSMCDCILGDYVSAMRRLPKIDPATQYYQVAVNLSWETAPEWLEKSVFLGCDLADDCWRSSVHNYGPWSEHLGKIALHVNQYGLLKLADARAAKALMATHFDRAYAHVDLSIWGLYELAPEGIMARGKAEGKTVNKDAGGSRDIEVN